MDWLSVLRTVKKKNTERLPNVYGGKKHKTSVLYWISTINQYKTSITYGNVPLNALPTRQIVEKTSREKLKMLTRSWNTKNTNEQSQQSRGPPENRNQLESTGINLNQPESKSSVPKSYTKPPKSTAWKPQSTGINRNQQKIIKCTSNPLISTAIHVNYA